MGLAYGLLAGTIRSDGDAMKGMARAMETIACISGDRAFEPSGVSHSKEDVWDYPRPPRLERVGWPVRIEHQGFLVAEADEVHRVLETTHPPVYYIHPRYLTTDCIRPSRRQSTWCEWKGQADYVDLVLPTVTIEAAGWRYPDPAAGFEVIAGSVAFYASLLDACYVDGEQVRAQPGDFYGGWITSWIVGGRRGFKGGPGTWGW